MTRDPMTSSLLPYAPERDVYRLLQVEPTANDQEIAVACRRLALAFHPDYNRSPRAHEEMQIVNAVRSLLSDPRSRAAYDGARRRFLYHGRQSWPAVRRAATTPTWVARTVASHPTAPRSVAPRPAPAQITPFEPRTSWMGLLHRRASRVTQFEPYRPWMGLLHRRARRAAIAVIAAVRSALAELGPARCPNCRESIQPTDRYCAWCGTWVGRTEKLSGA